MRACVCAHMCLYGRDRQRQGSSPLSQSILNSLPWSQHHPSHLHRRGDKELDEYPSTCLLLPLDIKMTNILSICSKDCRGKFNCHEDISFIWDPNGSRDYLMFVSWMIIQGCLQMTSIWDRSQISELYVRNRLCLCWHNCACLVTKLCLTLCDPMNCSLPGFPVRGILQARILE